MMGAKDTGILVQGYSKKDFKKGDKVVIMENLGDKYKVSNEKFTDTLEIPKNKLLLFSISKDKFQVTEAGSYLYRTPKSGTGLIRELNVNEEVTIQPEVKDKNFYLVKTAYEEFGFIKKNSGKLVEESVKPSVYSNKDFTLTNASGDIQPIKQNTKLSLIDLKGEVAYVVYNNIIYTTKKENINFTRATTGSTSSTYQAQNTENSEAQATNEEQVKPVKPQDNSTQQNITSEEDKNKEEVVVNTETNEVEATAEEVTIDAQLKKEQKKPSKTQNELRTSLTKGAGIRGNQFTTAQEFKGETLVDYAKTMIGTPYVWGGTSLDGLDCSGFTSKCYKDALGIKINRVSRDQIDHGYAVTVDQLQPGDLVFFNKENGGIITHVGMYAGDNMMIHASQSQGKVVMVSTKTDYFRNRLVTARRIITN